MELATEQADLNSRALRETTFALGTRGPIYDPVQPATELGGCWQHSLQIGPRRDLLQLLQLRERHDERLDWEEGRRRFRRQGFRVALVLFVALWAVEGSIARGLRFRSSAPSEHRDFRYPPIPKRTIRRGMHGRC